MGEVQLYQRETYRIVPASSISDDALLGFASTVWPDRSRRMLTAWWRCAAPECAVAAIDEASGDVAGICAGRPSIWVIGGKIYDTVSICDWFVDPRRQGKLLGRRLLRRFEAPGRILNGLSISDVAVAYLQRMGWAGPFSSSLMALPVPGVASLLTRLRAGRCSSLELDDHVVTEGQLPQALATDLDLIEEARAHELPARMRRGADTWSWHVSIFPDRVYRFCLASRAGQPVGYVAVRKLAPGGSRQLGNVPGALVCDLVALGDDPVVLRQLGARAVAYAAQMHAVVALFVTTSPAHRSILGSIGFISSSLPLLGPTLARRAPVYMWSRQGPGGALAPDDVTMTFLDAALDLDL